MAQFDPKRCLNIIYDSLEQFCCHFGVFRQFSKMSKNLGLFHFLNVLGSLWGVPKNGIFSKNTKKYHFLVLPPWSGQMVQKSEKNRNLKKNLENAEKVKKKFFLQKKIHLVDL